MERSIDHAGMAAFGVGSILLLAAAGLLFTGNLHLVGYAVPLALAGLLATGLGYRRVDRSLHPSA